MDRCAVLGRQATDTIIVRTAGVALAHADARGLDLPPTAAGGRSPDGRMDGAWCVLIADCAVLLPHDLSADSDGDTGADSVSVSRGDGAAAPDAPRIRLTLHRIVPVPSAHVDDATTTQPVCGSVEPSRLFARGARIGAAEIEVGAESGLSDGDAERASDAIGALVLRHCRLGAPRCAALRRALCTVGRRASARSAPCAVPRSQAPSSPGADVAGRAQSRHSCGGGGGWGSRRGRGGGA